MIELKNKNSYGFTLIEIIISLVLGLLLTIAITTLYIYTNNLNKVALDKLNFEQNVTFLTNIISKDASMAGSFACLSLGSINSPDSINNDYTFNNLFYIKYKDNVLPPIATDRLNSKYNNGIIPKENESFGVLLIDSDKFSNLNDLILKKNSPVLIFFYGTGSTGISNINISNTNKLQSISFTDGDTNKNVDYTNKLGGFLALSSCEALNIFKGNKQEKLSFNTNDFGDIDMLNEKFVRNQYDYAQKVNHHLENEISLLKLNTIAYFLAKTSFDTEYANDEYSLYRLEMASDGTWENPELMLNKVTNIDINFLYATAFDEDDQAIGCPSAVGFNAQNINTFNNYKIVSSKQHFYDIKNNFQISPASLNLKLKLKSNNNQNSLQNETEQDKHNTDNNEINISAVIRGGNTCANRKIIN